jgi:thioredoxin reductase
MADDEPMTDIDVVVVGAGPAGLSAALLLGRANRSAVLIDGGPGRNEPSEAVHSFLGHDGTSPADLRSMGLDEVTSYPSVTALDGRVTGIAVKDGAFVVERAEGDGFRSRRVVLATGVTDDLPPIDGLAALWGRSVLHCPYCHGWEQRGRAVAVLPLESLHLLMALKLTHLTDDVVVCLNNDLELSPDEDQMLDAAGVPVRPERIARLEADGDRLREIVFADGTSIERDALFVHPSVQQASPLPTELGCRLLDNGLVEVDDIGHTSIDGVYAVGDMAHRATNPFPGQQVAMAVAEGAAAAIAIDQELLLTDLPTAG